MDVSDKLLDKLQKIKAHAESAKAIGSEAEAQTFANNLQRLLLEHDLQLSDIEFERHEVEDPVTDQLVNLADHGLKSKRSRVLWAERLASRVARANFCRIIVISGSNSFFLVGRHEHRAVAEYMIVTLTRAVESIATKEYGAFYRECIRVDGSPRRARGFREAFIVGFLQRLFERLDERKTEAGASTSTALMRLSREDRAVEEEMARRAKLNKDDPQKTSASSSLRPSSATNREGVHRGKRAAEGVDLSGRAIEPTTPKKRLR